MEARPGRLLGPAEADREFASAARRAASFLRRDPRPVSLVFDVVLDASGEVLLRCLPPRGGLQIKASFQRSPNWESNSERVMLFVIWRGQVY